MKSTQTKSNDSDKTKSIKTPRSTKEKKDKKSESESAASDEDEDSSVAKPNQSLPTNSKDWKNVIILNQQFNGCWDEADIIKIVGKVRAKKLLRKNPCGSVAVWCNALVLALLELKCMEVKASWEVVANKGRTFMTKKLFELEKKNQEETFQLVMDLIAQAKETFKQFGI